MTPPIKKERKDASTLDIVNTSPQDNTDNVAVNTTIQMTFNESLQSGTVNTSTILVERES